MTVSLISSKVKRAGDILRKGASDQIVDYTRRFDSIKGIYDGFLENMMKKNFCVADAAATAKAFFGSDKVKFAAVDGTEYTRPMFDLVIFFGGSYAAKGFIQFEGNEPKIEYSTKFSEESVGISSCVPIYINEIVEVEQTYMQLGQDGNVTVNMPLTDEAVIKQLHYSQLDHDLQRVLFGLQAGKARRSEDYSLGSKSVQYAQ